MLVRLISTVWGIAINILWAYFVLSDLSNAATGKNPMLALPMVVLMYGGSIFFLVIFTPVFGFAVSLVYFIYMLKLTARVNATGSIR